MVSKVKIKQNCALRYDVEVNDNLVQGVTGVNFHVAVNEIPQIDLDMYSDFEYDGLADIGVGLTPESTIECVKGLRFALMTDKELYNAFLSSVKSAIDEADNYVKNEKLAESILDRIIGDVCNDGIEDYRDSV